MESYCSAERNKLRHIKPFPCESYRVEREVMIESSDYGDDGMVNIYFYDSDDVVRMEQWSFNDYGESLAYECVYEYGDSEEVKCTMWDMIFDKVRTQMTSRKAILSERRGYEILEDAPYEEAHPIEPTFLPDPSWRKSERIWKVDDPYFEQEDGSSQDPTTLVLKWLAILLLCAIVAMLLFRLVHGL